MPINARGNDDHAWALALQDDGKILAAGEADVTEYEYFNSGNQRSGVTTLDFGLSRLNADCSMDIINGNGRVTLRGAKDGGTISGGGKADAIFGNSGNDTLNGNKGPDAPSWAIKMPVLGGVSGPRHWCSDRLEHSVHSAALSGRR